MTDLLLQIGGSNLCISALLALVAWGVHRSGKSPMMAHLLWVLVLVKLITPPLMTIPIVPFPAVTEISLEAVPEYAGPETVSTNAGATELGGAESGPIFATSSRLDQAKTAAILLWLFGSVSVLVWSVLRIYRFNRFLVMASEVAPPELQATALEIGRRLGLKSAPTIYTTTAQLSPLVWWIGGRVRVLFPVELPREMDADQFRWILAHELAHVRRRDYLVRWLEWLACVGFWWNPVAWWARRNLRINEEICCDALVLSSLKPNPRTYANSLMTVVEFLASPALRPPAMASEINSGGFLEKRFRMIVAKNRVKRTPRWIMGGVLLLTVGLMPLGVTYAQDTEAVGRRLREAVAAGELTAEQARAMMEALTESKRSADEDAKPERPALALRRIRQAIANGDMTAEEGRARLRERRMAAGEGERGAARRIGRADYVRAEAEMKKMVEAGTITNDAMVTRLNEMRKALAGERKPDEQRITREEYARAAVEIRKSVEAGRVSEDDALVRLGAMRRMIEGEGERGAERRISREDYARAETEMKRMVEAGRITKEAMANRLNRMRRLIGPGRGEGEGARRTERRINREDYIRAEAEMRKLVEAGTISKEDLQIRLNEMRRMTRRDGERPRAERNFTKEDYARAAEAIKKAVDAGRISEEDAIIRLDKMRRSIAAQAERGEVAPEIDWEAIQKRVEGAVKEGKMTREEADTLYKRIKERMSDAKENKLPERRR